MKPLIILLLVALSHAASASRECDWAITVWKNDPANIAAANQQINFIKSLIAKENETLDKQVYPQLAAWKHTLSVYDANSSAARQAQLAVNDAILYLQESIIANLAVKRTLDRMTSKVRLTSDRRLSDQMREAIPKLKLKDSTKAILEQWINAVALVEATQPDWNETEKQILSLLPESKTSLSALLIDRLRDLNNKLQSELERLKSGRDQDQSVVGQLENSVAEIQKKIAGYLNQIAEHQKKIAGWQNEMNSWSPRIHCPEARPRLREPLR